MISKNFIFWSIWIVSTLAIGGYLSAAMVFKGDRSHFLIGETTVGHHQIELACNACHSKGFSDVSSIQKSCENCHAAELKISDDSHPLKKFRDPRNADRLAKLDVTKCVTCHTEHRPELTQPMGLTMPKDYCFLCHQDIGKDRPETHQNLEFTSCASAGCHNYHDNRALYERFLERHATEPDMKPNPFVLNHDAEPLAEDYGGLKRGDALSMAAADAPGSVFSNMSGDAKEAVLTEWHQDAHARNGVNCSGCHQPGKAVKADGAASKPSWIGKPGRAVCASCHVQENKGFLAGKHGMRQQEGLLVSEGKAPAFLKALGLFEKQELTPMRPELARSSMKANAHGRELSCTSCHGRGALATGKEGDSLHRNSKTGIAAGLHNFDVQPAKVQACISCHDSEHTKTYLGSPHHELWVKELKGELPKGSGVTCATCHMPRVTVEDEYENFITIVAHNQNDNLRPNEKMIRSVCSSCHGLRFTIDALADETLVRKNFRGKPQTHIESIDWVLRRSSKKGDEK